MNGYYYLSVESWDLGNKNYKILNASQRDPKLKNIEAQNILPRQ